MNVEAERDKIGQQFYELNAACRALERAAAVDGWVTVGGETMSVAVRDELVADLNGQMAMLVEKALRLEPNQYVQLPGGKWLKW